jgi:hypothetical protein
MANLADPVWLRLRYAIASDAAIALELGVDRKTVRRARMRHGIASQPVGPRRGVPRPVTSSSEAQQGGVDGLTPAERRLIDRYRADRRNAPTKELLTKRIVAAHQADAAGDHLAYEAAMLDVAVAAARIAEHEMLLRRAA